MTIAVRSAVRIEVNEPTREPAPVTLARSEWNSSTRVPQHEELAQTKSAPVTLATSEWNSSTRVPQQEEPSQTKFALPATGNRSALMAASRQLAANSAILLLVRMILCAGDDDEAVVGDVLGQVLSQLGRETLVAIENLLWNQGTTNWAVAELLATLGKIDPNVLYQERRNMLHYALQHRSSPIRDGAMIGLAAMMDSSSASALRIAALRETVPDIRRDMIALADRLAGGGNDEAAPEN